MSERVICEKSDLVAIANSVREVTGSTDTYNVPQLKEYIADTIKPINRAIPSIALNTSDGTITAATDQEQGYVAAGQESITMSLPTQGATTITPTTEPQTAVSAGTYVTGDIVVGAAEGGGDALKAIIERTITEFEDDSIETLGPYAFNHCYTLTSVNFPACTTIDMDVFGYCSNLTLVNFPVCTTIGPYAFDHCYNLTSISFPMCMSIKGTAFNYCESLTSVNFPMCTNLDNYVFQSCYNLISVSLPVCTSISHFAFGYCSNLTSVNFPACTSINMYAFRGCRILSSFTLGASTVCTLTNSNAFGSTPFAGYSDYFSGTPYIYVPASLLTSYQTATNWVYFSSYFSTIESLEGTT